MNKEIGKKEKYLFTESQVVWFDEKHQNLERGSFRPAD